MKLAALVEAGSIEHMTKNTRVGSKTSTRSLLIKIELKVDLSPNLVISLRVLAAEKEPRK